MATSNQQVSDGETCPECTGRVYTDAAERVCSACGLVMDEDRMDHGPEWREFDASDRSSKRRTRAGDRDRFDRGLGSVVGFNHERSGRMNRLDRWDRQAKLGDKRDRNRGYATGEITRIGNALDLGDSLIQQAKSLFRQVQDADKCIGRDLDTVAATCVYTVARIHRRGVTPSEVAEVSRSDGKRIARRHKWLCDEAGLEVPPPDPRQRVRVVASACGVDRSDVQRVLARLDEMDDAEVCRGSPSVLAAALLYDSGAVGTQNEVCEAAGCSAAAIRNRLEGVE